MVRRDDLNKKMARIRWIVLSAVGGVVALIITFGIFYSTSTFEQVPVEGQNYSLIRNPSPDTTPLISVREFFSYGCIHCRNLERLLPGWKAGLAADVRFISVPLAGNSAWLSLARSHYALNVLKLTDQHHEDLFKAIHDQRINLGSLAAIADWMDGRGLARDKFMAVARSAVVDDMLDQGGQLARAFQVRSVPTLVVAGKYLIAPGIGARETLSLANRLIAMEREARANAASAKAP